MSNRPNQKQICLRIHTNLAERLEIEIDNTEATMNQVLSELVRHYVEQPMFTKLVNQAAARKSKKRIQYK